jgi:hypothetical protein
VPGWCRHVSVTLSRFGQRHSLLRSESNAKSGISRKMTVCDILILFAKLSYELRFKMTMVILSMGPLMRRTLSSTRL